MASERLEKALAAQRKAAEAVRKARNADAKKGRDAETKIKILLGAAVMIDRKRNGSKLYDEMVRLLDPKDQNIIREKEAIYNAYAADKAATSKVKAQTEQKTPSSEKTTA